MTVLAAAFCPQPLLLAPEYGASRGLVPGLATACAAAVGWLRRQDVDAIAVLATEGGTLTHRSGPPAGLRIGTALLDAAGWTGARLPQLVPETASPAVCRTWGADLAGAPGRLGLLVMGDGSACRAEDAPGGHDERAVPFDDAVLAAVRTGDTAALGALDPSVATAVRAAGRAPWQVAAGALGTLGVHAEVLLAAAPLGVFYLVATWELSPEL